MNKRGRIGLGMALGGLWGVGAIAIGSTLATAADLPTALALAFLGPGVILAAVIGRLAQRRFFDDRIIDGGAFAGAAEIDARVLQNTVEQIVLALALWPATGVLLRASGPGVVMALGGGFTLARLGFWIGYHIAPPLRAFGFAATFYPTLLALAWAGLSRLV